MNARLSESAATACRTRVVSVSPHSVSDIEPRVNPVAASVEPPPPEQPAPSDFQALMQHARDVTASLTSALDQAAAGDVQARDTMRSLQDRLRVGARMLQAFQAQITRIETGIAELEHQCEATAQTVQADAARLDDQAAAFEQRLEAALEQFERRLSELLRVR